MSRKSAEASIQAIDGIKTYIDRNWPGFFDAADSETNRLAWRQSKMNMFPFKEQDCDDIDKFRFLALSEQSVAQMSFPDNGLQQSGSAWKCMPSADLANLCYDWQKSPIILEFDSDLTAQLQSSDIDSTVNISEYLSHLPFSCFFVSSEHLGFRLSNKDNKLKSASGFFVDHTWMPRTDLTRRVEKHLTITILSKNGNTIPIVFPLRFSSTKELVSYIAETYMQSSTGEKSLLKRAVEEDVHTILSLLLYIASEKPDVADAETGEAVLSETFFSEKPTDTSCRSEQAADAKNINPRVLAIGRTIGPELAKKNRIDKQTNTGRTVAPHFRRAHFHTYNIGPRNGKQQRVLRWIGQTPVNMKNGDASNAMVRRVE